MTAGRADAEGWDTDRIATVTSRSGGRREEAPTVSVVLPTYNRAARLLRCIDSILAQGYRNFELIVVDDGSTDDTRTRVRRVGDSRVVYYHKQNEGPAAARNYGVERARGDIVTFLDSDDLVRPRWLREIVDRFDESGVAIVCCGFQEVRSADLERAKATVLPRVYGPVFDRLEGLYATGGVYAMTRPLFLSLGGFDENATTGEHTELAIRLGEIVRERGFRVLSIMEPLVLKIQHEGDHLFSDPRARFEGARHVIAKHHRKLRRDPRLLSDYHGVAGVNAARIGRMAEARHHLFRSASIARWSPKRWIRVAISLVPGLVRRVWRVR